MESPKEAPKEIEPPQSDGTPKNTQDSPKKTRKSPKKPPKKGRDALKKSTREEMAEAKARQTLFNSKVHTEISSLLQAVKGTPYGPILSDIYDVYVSHKQKDDDFLRRQKNRIVKESTVERDDFETITSEWTTQFEGAIKARVRLLQAQADAGPSEKTEEQRLKEQQSMDSGIKEVILQMLGQYQGKIKSTKREVTKHLTKFEVENFEKYQKGLAEQELQLLTLFRRLIPAVQMSTHPTPRSFQAAGIENINPAEARAKANLKPELENKDVEREDEDHPLSSVDSVGAKKRRISFEGEN